MALPEPQTADAVPRARPMIEPLVAASRTTAVAPTDPFELLARAEGRPRFLYWNGQTGTVGVGVATHIDAEGPSTFRAVRETADRAYRRLGGADARHAPGRVGPRWIGGFAFDPVDASVRGSEFPAARFVLPSRIWSFEDGHVWRTEVGAAAAPAPADASDRASRSRPGIGTIAWQNEPDFGAWAHAVRSALQAIRAGRIEKIVLARTVSARLPRPPDLARMLSRLAQQTPMSRTFLFEPRAGRAFLGESPEVLVERIGGILRTVALAGSRPRGRTPEEDADLERALRASSKEAWEHELVSRFLRGRLERRGGPWRTPVERGVLKLPNVQHLETRFEAASGPDEHVLELAERFHPTPAVAGHPRAQALRLISQLEGRPRGWYGGAIGWFDAAGDGALSVGIRSALVDGRDVTMFAGCGIVEGSDPAEEWEESRDKLRLLQSAFEAEADAP